MNHADRTVALCIHDLAALQPCKCHDQHQAEHEEAQLPLMRQQSMDPDVKGPLLVVP